MKKIQKILQWIVLLFFGSTIFFVILYRFVPVPLTPLMIIRCVQQVSRGEQIRLKHHWVPMEDISKYLPVAVMHMIDFALRRNEASTAALAIVSGMPSFVST